MYADKNMRIIADAHNFPLKIKALESVQVGEFKITPIEREHSKIISLFEFLPGPIHQDFNFNFWDYKVGSTWVYLIEHPKGNILIDDSVGFIPKLNTKIDVLFQGVANRESDEEVLSGVMKAYPPRLFIPIHFDNFFADLREKEPLLIPGVDLEGLSNKMKDVYPTLKFHTPVFGKSFKLFE